MFDPQIIRYEFDEYCLDVLAEKLFKHGNEINLTRKAFQILLFLVRNSGQVVGKDQIFESLWSDSFVHESNLTQYIYLLRKALDQENKGQSYIETLNKLGYRFNAQVKRIHSDKAITNNEQSLFSNSNIDSTQRIDDLNSDDISDQIKDKTSSKNIPGNLSNSHKLLSRSRRFSLGLISLSIVLLVTAGIFYKYRSTQNISQSDENKIKSIAILPFKSIGANENDKKIGLGMSDAIIIRLSKLQQIPVLPTSAVFAYADKIDIDPLAAGNELGVDSVLTGTIQHDGNRIRVSVQLLNTADQKPLWTETFDENYTSIFEIQDSISLKVAQNISENLTNDQKKLLTKHDTENIEASQAFQFGIYFWNKRTKADLEKAITHFHNAITLDPNYAKAYAMLADSYLILGNYRYADLQKMLTKAQPLAEKSLALDNSLAEGYIALAFIQSYKENNIDKPKKNLEKAISLSPYNSIAHLRYGWLLLGSKDLEGAMKQMRLAQQYDPLSPVSNSALCFVLTSQENFSDAIDYCEKGVSLAQDNILIGINLAEAYFFGGKREKAIAHMKRLIKLDSNSTYALATLSFFYAKLDRKNEAKEIVSKLETEAKKDKYLLPHISTIHYVLGDKDKAFRYFNESIENDALSPTSFYYEQTWKEIRSDKRFQEAYSAYE